MDKKLKILTTNFDGLFIIEPNIFSDERGSFSRVYCEEELNEVSDVVVKQVNHSITKVKGTVRGLHFQYEPNSEVKIVKCIRGRVFDVVVDLRKNSDTFLKTFSVELTSDNQKMLYIPKGFAHGFQTLENDIELLYLHSSLYVAAKEGGLHVKDPILKIQWPLDIVNLSSRDSNHEFLKTDFKGIEVHVL